MTWSGLLLGLKSRSYLFWEFKLGATLPNCQHHFFTNQSDKALRENSSLSQITCIVVFGNNFVIFKVLTNWLVQSMPKVLQCWDSEGSWFFVGHLTYV